MSNTINVLEGNWKQIKGIIRETWGKITQDEIAKMRGKYEELEGELQKKYGYDEKKAKSEIDNFLKKNKFN